MKISKNINISIGLGIIACVIAVAFRLFSEADLWFQMFSAILGVIITIIITNLLLNSQSSQDIIRERNAEVFKEKLRIYQEFLQALYTILKEEAMTPDEIMKLQFQISYISMHTKSEHIRTISEYVSEIVKIYAQCPNEKDLRYAAVARLSAIRRGCASICDTPLIIYVKNIIDYVNSIFTFFQV